MVDNAEWLTRLNYIEFLRDVGRHFSVNRMLSMDSVGCGWSASRSCRSSNSTT
jgi:tyrosyl-tRNA synthetase